ncbi:hypothetical protein PHO31112_04603 [Pandoraea horticolens]|uniref:DUF2029 domain-containing protein n=1 Tax=Pandoraea horticolens TaxID=2508298 RepID=A0A5E4YL02_9BURK|nr:hypothetical protein [Pandoraea horticolens]VVE49454.1 hypothetical protein PHO31112_04603 [Pandoraea horticolens]
MKTSDTGDVVHARQPPGNEQRPQTAHWLTLECVRLYAIAALVCQVIVGICWIAHIHFDTTDRLNPLALDFLPFRSGAWMALQGHAANVYNVVAPTCVEIMAEPAMAHAPLWRAWTLLLAALPMSPYVRDYDRTWFGILIAWPCAHGQAHGWRTGEREWLVLLWLTSLAGVMVVSFVGFQFMPFITIATLAGALRRLRLDSPPGSACAMVPLANGGDGDGDSMYAVSP